MTIQIDTIEPPVPPSDEHKGRASYKVMLADGTKCFANAAMGKNLIEGDSYDNIVINQDDWQNNWLNWIKDNGGQSRPVTASVQAPASRPAGKPYDYKQASIITQAFLKEIIKTAPQEKWSEMLDFAWTLHDDKLTSRAAAKKANGQQHKTQITEPAPPPPPAPPIPTGAPEAPTPTAEVLDDQIPF